VQQSDFDQLYASRFTLSYVTALGVTRNPHDAQDVAQSVFCKIWANREAMDGEGPGRGWFIRAARNAAIDLVRHKARCEKVSVLFTDRIAEGTETQAIRKRSPLLAPGLVLSTLVACSYSPRSKCPAGDSEVADSLELK
jgi:DNA-directed RNA polymerase specialized sigma24 family protein